MAIFLDNVQKHIFVGFKDFIFGAIGVKPYLATSNFTPNTSSYITVNILEINPISWCATSASPPDSLGETHTYSQYLTTVEIRVIGVDALTVCQGIVNALKDKTLLRALQAKGIGYSSASPVRNISIPVNNERVETRASATVSAYFVQGGKDQGTGDGWIERVTISPEYFYSDPDL